MGVRVGLHAHHYEGRRERSLGDPVHRGRGHGVVLSLRGQHVEAVGDHAQRRLLRIGVHVSSPPGSGLVSAGLELYSMDVPYLLPISRTGKLRRTRAATKRTMIRPA